MNFRSTPIQPPSLKEKIALRAMIITGYCAAGFFLYNMFLSRHIGNKPLYILLMITMVYYCLKYLHEWYHYFSISVSPKPLTQNKYRVDILTTYCAGEPFEMLAETLTAIQNITYPHTAWCCDEADDPAVKALCQKLGVQHITRTEKKNAKAGNINNALQFASGELCVVMDPDHIPSPDFLDAVVGYFDNPKIGFVQVVQAYYNQKESMVAKGAAQQTYQFYGPMMMCMNTYGTVQAIGANCTFRRAALDSIGGHAAGLSEDMHTAMQLHSKGWQSVYHPVIITRGLVPATMSSYYKQQLKWSRGTWELLMATYPKLFRHFTWRQRLHYFLLPFHYLSGIIFFLNFLIPVISLFTGAIPLKMDVLVFILSAFPMFTLSVFIRHYVQKWVAEESERGFHIVGGILQIGAWWVHSIGFIYTLLRKEVPYIPTPKNDTDKLPLLLNLPNFIIAGISAVAIVYGFTSNYNPYTVFMAVLALLQIAFMLFVFSISGYAKKDGRVKGIAMRIRKKTWLIIQMHGFLRRYSVPLSLSVVTLFVFGYKKMQDLPTFLPEPLPGLTVLYKGVTVPADSAGQFNSAGIFTNGNAISIAAFTIQPDSSANLQLPVTAFETVYTAQGIPLMNWMPFSNNPKVALMDNELMTNIIQGKHDSVFINLARQMAALQKPIFINMHLGKTINDTIQKLQPDNYITAWQHIHDLFDSLGADKTIWVWNTWDDPKNITYFPGNYYADWLQVNLPSCKDSSNAPVTKTFRELYTPYHRLALINTGLPVMVNCSGASTIPSGKWCQQAEESIDSSFTEIKSILLPTAYSNQFNAIAKGNFTNDIKEVQILTAKQQTKKFSLPDSIKGIVYDKGYFWFRNRHTLTRSKLELDIEAMKNIGINTIERSVPGFYDNIFDELLQKNNMKQIARFVTLTGTAELDNDNHMSSERTRILSVVKNNQNKKNIIAWNLGSDILYNLENQSYKPGNFYYRNKYVNWLNSLCEGIRQIDTIRPIIADLNWDARGKKRLSFYQQHVPGIDKYLLTATTKNRAGLKGPLPKNTAWGKVPVEMWDSLPAIRQSGFIPAWQDIENTDYITLNGLLDLDNRHKQWYRTVINAWTKNKTPESPVPDIKILKPAKFTRQHAELEYHIMYRQDTTQWKLYNNQIPELNFEWYLVRVDQYGNTMFIKKAGEGSYIKLPIPESPEYYELYVEAVIKMDVKMARSKLNTPLL